MNRRKFGQLMAATALEGALLHAGAQTPPAAPGARFSCELWILGKELSFDHGIEMIAAAGYQGVELTAQFRDWTPEERRRVLAKLRSLGLMIDMLSGLQASFAIPGTTAEFLAKTTEHMKIAKELGSPQINVKSGQRLEGIDPEMQRAAAIDNLKRASDVAAENGIEIVIEPIDPIENPTIFLQSVSVGFEIVRAVNRPNVKVLYDIYHEQRTAGNLIEKLEKNIDWVGLIHVASVPGRHEPETGEINYTNVYRTLGRLHYNRFIAMEYSPLGDTVASLRKAKADAQRAMSLS